MRKRTSPAWFVNRGSWLVIGAAMVVAGCESQAQVAELEQAKASFDARRYADAIAAADTYLARSPTGPHAAEAYYLKGRALEDSAAANPGEARANLQSARTAFISALQTGVKDKRLEGNIRASLADVAYWQEDYATAAEQWVAAYDLLDDATIKAWSLYRGGVSQQRLGHYEKADKTLSLVAADHPDTEPGRRAKTRIGIRGFYVQVATFADKRTADRAIQTLTKSGQKTNTRATSDGKTVVLVGPFANYAQANTARTNLTATYPDALITP